MALRYQPLNENLTNFSNTKVLGKGFISHKAFVAMSDFFSNALDLRTVSNFLKQLEIADIGYKNQITVNHVPENTISNDKFNPPLPVDPQFVTGDILRTFKLGNKDGFVPLETNRTLGSLSSSASYRGSAYYPLYELLWKRNVTNVYDISGNVATRGESALSDFQNNISVGLPNKSNGYSYSPNTVLTNATSASSGTIRVNQNGYYRLICVAGGGGGSNSFGGAGAGIHCILRLAPGVTYSYTVGAGGKGADPYVRNNDGANGSNSTFSGTGVSITCGGGIRRQGRRNGGGGGNTGNLSYSITNEHVLIARTTNGVQSNASFITGNSSGAGAGGQSQPDDKGAGYAGKTGLVKVEYLGILYPSNDSNSNNVSNYEFMNKSSLYMKL
jgi:hypothetical protein